MPSLGPLSCEVIIANNNRTLPEYNTTYYNQAVQTHIAVPSYRARFQITLKADSFIASGLAAFVFIDGNYQTNRNKRGYTENGKSKFEVLFSGAETAVEKDKVIKAGWWFDNVNFGIYTVDIRYGHF